MAVAMNLLLGAPSSDVWIGECDKHLMMVPCQRRDRLEGSYALDRKKV